MKTLKKIALFIGCILLGHISSAFCGFYVAKADSKLFNKTSQVILARDGNFMTVTMSSDFEGDVKDFAMVVPVPTVLQEQDIRTVRLELFEKLDAYSAPRLAEYYDPRPCYVPPPRKLLKHHRYAESANYEWAPVEDIAEEEDLGVTVEASYEVDEYDVLILSAEESSGLEKWLIQNDYKIPQGASDVLEPYIKNGMKFFVVKVNTAKLEKRKDKTLNPLQMSFESEKFMLPIRLGMANSNGDQDMIVYCLTKKGRVETTNYRTEKIPTNMDIPLSVEKKFGEFYKAVFDTKYQKESGRPVFLEYAWDISGNAGVKCDPCVGPPPIYTDLVEAGATWLNLGDPEQQNWGNANYGACFFTRLHVRYNRQTFPQDLKFQVTPNKNRFQGRYVLHHPAEGDLSCEKGQKYIHTLKDRRKKEVENLASLTGWNTKDYTKYIHEYDRFLKKPKRNTKAEGKKETGDASEPTDGASTLAQVSKKDTPEVSNYEKTRDLTPANPINLAESTSVLVPAEVSGSSQGNFKWWFFGGLTLLISATLYKHKPKNRKKS